MFNLPDQVSVQGIYSNDALGRYIDKMYFSDPVAMFVEVVSAFKPALFIIIINPIRIGVDIDRQLLALRRCG